MLLAVSSRTLSRLTVKTCARARGKMTMRLARAHAPADGLLTRHVGPGAHMCADGGIDSRYLLTGRGRVR